MIFFFSVLVAWTCVVCLFAFLSWIAFFGIIDGFEDADLCPSPAFAAGWRFGTNVTDDEWWCDSFSGEDSFSDYWKITWGPYVGWSFALSAWVWALVLPCIICCMEIPEDYVLMK